MKIKIFYILILLLKLTVSGNAQETLLMKNIQLEKEEQTVEQFLGMISDQSGILFSYSTQQIDPARKILISEGVKNMKEVLLLLMEKYDIDYQIVENQIVLKRKGKKKAFELDHKLYSISGYLYDASSGESLIGAAIIVSGTAFGSISNAFGYYSLSLPEGNYELQFSYIAYENQRVAINLKENRSRNIYLQASRIILPSVLIKTDLRKELLSGSQMSRLDIQIEQLNKIPEFGGEVGLIKGLQTLPGIKSHSDGSAFFFVRGGEKDQNLIIIDDAPVYNPSHLFGYYSMVIPDFTKDIKVYKSDMPVHLGDRLSSIIDIRTNDGNLKNFHLTGMLNPLVSRFSLEGPIVKNKSSFFTSLRFSNIQWIYQNYVPNLDFGFNDLNFKWNYLPNKKNRFFFSYFFGSDLLANNYTETSSAGIRWNNMASSLRWNRLVNDQLFMNMVLVASIYQYQLLLGGNKWRSNIANVSLKTDFSYYPRPDLKFNYGFNVSRHAFDPGSVSLGGATQLLPTITFGKSSELDLYVKGEHKISEKISYSSGLRMPLWNNTGPTTLYIYDENHDLSSTKEIENEKSYKSFVHLDPRLSLTYRVDSTSSIKLSYGAYHQYIHLLSNTTSPFTSIEVWLPSGINIKPQRADQIALGYYYNFKKQHINFSVEAYYKLMKNQIDYKPHANMLLNPYLEGELRFGKAKAYGIEFLAERKYAKLNGWISYTYSRVFRKTPEINEGKSYRAFRDRPHDFSLFLNYKLNEKVSFSTNWSYYTGSAITMPVAFYEYNGTKIPVYGDKNNQRLPDYHRLDLAFKYRFNKADSRFKHSLNISVYNVYGRKNPISINYNKIEKDGQLTIPGDLLENANLVYSQRDLLRFMPSISYKFEL